MPATTFRESPSAERIAIGKELGITVLPDPEMGMRQRCMLGDQWIIARYKRKGDGFGDQRERDGESGQNFYPRIFKQRQRDE